MTIGDIGTVVSAVVAILALGLSIFSVRKTNKFGETTDQLNRLLIDREKADNLTSKQADLSANIIELGKSKYRLKIFNRGKCVAKNVKLIDMDKENSVLIESDIEDKFPVPILEQHQSVELIAAVTFDSGPRIHIKLIWDDETGKNREKKLTLVI